MKIYLVGGAVRDMLMGLEPNDRDYVVVGSSPNEMLDLGYTQVGADFPVFLHPDTGEEYALARSERKIGPGYLGFETQFDSTVTLEQDLERRDFTMNAIAMDIESKEIIDPFCGQLDIKNKIIRHTSPAFDEDPLRVIRAARFYTKYNGFRIDTNTFRLCKSIAESRSLNEISDERFWAEFKKVNSKNLVNFFSVLFAFGVFDHCDMFKDTFGETDLYVFDDMSHNLSHINRLNIFVARIAYRCNAKLTRPSVPSDVRWLMSILKSNYNLLYNADEAVDFISHARGWFDIERLVIARLALPYCAFSLEELMIIVARTSKIDTSCAIDSSLRKLEGKEIGDWIRNERIKITENILKG